jgi:hypothetical protein
MINHIWAIVCLIYISGFMPSGNKFKTIDCEYAERVMEISSENIWQHNVGQNLLYQPDAFGQKNLRNKLWHVKDNQEQFVKLWFSRPVHSNTIFIYELINTGTVYEVKVFDKNNELRVTRQIESKNLKNRINVVNVYLGQVNFEIQSVLITIRNKYNKAYTVKIDAVGLC